MHLQRAAVIFVLIAIALVGAPAAADITSASLQISGAGLRVDERVVTTGIDIPITIQTSFAGKENDEAPAAQGLLAVGDLTGPGLETPIEIRTTPGYKFHVPGLPQPGDYYLQNVRLVSGTQTLQAAVPSMVKITVADLLKTSLKVRQLTPEEIRQRGIVLDSGSYDVFEYSFSFLVNGEEVEVPFPVLIDRRTHVVAPIVGETDRALPVPRDNAQPPRWSAPKVVPFELPEADWALEHPPGNQIEKGPTNGRHRIPAALVIPNSLAVLHQHFSVVLNITNGAPQGSTARLEDIQASLRINNPTGLRAAGSKPAVSFGQPVPIVDPVTGATFLVAQSEGEAEWILEGLRPGSYAVDVDIKATLRETGQEDVYLHAVPSAAVVVHDPRFNLTFSHPEVVRAGTDFSAFTFLSNVSGSEQTIRLADGLAECASPQVPNVCRVAGGLAAGEVTLASGEMKMFEYRLRSSVTGAVAATAGTVNDDNLSAAVQLHFAVSESGIPLSPATLVLPHYAKFVDSELVGEALRLLGLGFSLATAPMNQVTARFPQVIKEDVFYRANDIARAGQRIFIGAGEPKVARNALSNLLLDMLGNGVELREWDALRRSEESGRTAGAALIRQFRERHVVDAASMTGLAEGFADDTAHRGRYLFALVHAANGTVESRPLSIALAGDSGRTAQTANESTTRSWTRDLPFADLSHFDAFGRIGELAVIGRWTEDVQLVVTPSMDGPIDIELLFPGSADGTSMSAHFSVAGTANEVLRIPITPGADALNVLLPSGGFSATASAAQVVPDPVTIVGARQDLYLDPEGHKVSVLFSRPIDVEEGSDLLSKFAAQVAFTGDGISHTAARPVFAAAMQQDKRTVNLSFDHVLSTNASYSLDVSPLIDPVSGGAVTFEAVSPQIDNDRPAGVVYGHFLTGDNKPIASGEVRFFTGHRIGCLPGGGDACNPYREAPQYARTQADGSFLFEYVPRDPIADPGLTGSYKAVAVSSEGRHTIVEGSVRQPGRVHVINLQLLGRGIAEGTVRYENGESARGVRVHVSSSMFGIGATTITDASGAFRLSEVPVGPITFSALDEDGNSAFASGEIATPGEVETRNLLILRKTLPGIGTVYGVIRRADTGATVLGARVGVYSQGHGIQELLTGADGRFEFRKVPAGFVTVLAMEASISDEVAVADFDLRADETKAVDLSLGIVATDTPRVRVAGIVLREHPLYPGDPSKYEPVPQAIVKLGGRSTTADADGRYSFDAVPATAGDPPAKKVLAYDPATKRTGDTTLPGLSNTQGVANLAIFIPANSYGQGTIRVVVVDARGVPADGFRVIEPGYPPTRLTAVGSGVYEYRDAPVGHRIKVYAVQGPAQYGDQYAAGTVGLDFPGQTATIVLRLPGQGTVRARLRGDFDLIGPVDLVYGRWNENEQSVYPYTRTASTDENGLAGLAMFNAVPALEGYTVSSSHPVYGVSSQSGKLAYDGDLLLHTLQLNKLASVSGTVFAIDATTPVAGAAVRLYDGARDAGVVLSQPDGRFVFHDVPASTDFKIVAEATQGGIYRTGVAFGKTPILGGPAPETPIILRRRGSLEGRVVYSDYKVYDPFDPAIRVTDPTPGDLSDNAPVPLAKFWLRELDFPGRSHGSSLEPLTTDASGRFALGNVFVGALRAKAFDSSNQEMTGDWAGTLDEEGQIVGDIYIGIGDGGTGALQVRVVDPNQQYLPVANAEVRLYRNGLFDLTSTDDAGIAVFNELPVGNYGVDAYSKSLGKSGAGVNVDVPRDAIAEGRVLLEFVGRVGGRLTDPMSGPAAAAPGIPVRLDASAFYAQSSTDAEGEFSFEGVREGPFHLSALDRSKRRASARGEVTPANRHPFVPMELEATESLHLEFYLPDDSGANSGRLAGPVAAEVRQRCPFTCDYVRALQGNPLEFPNLFSENGDGGGEQYGISAREIGGAERIVGHTGVFPKGSAGDPLKLVLPAFGDVAATITQGGLPGAGARVQIGGSNGTVDLVADSEGKVRASGLALGPIFVQARSIDGRFSGSATTMLERTSVVASASIELGAYVGITGVVEAETGGPSIGTRVVAAFAGRTLEIRTNDTGVYSFYGIPASSLGTAVALTYVGPDEITIGARQTAIVSSEDASATKTVGTVRLDATPPRIVSIVPLDGAQSVSPDSAVRVVFSEPLIESGLTPANLQIVAADGSGQVDALYGWKPLTDGSFEVTIQPRKTGESFPLRSNTLYRVVVLGGLEDMTGHGLAAARATSFTTSDYAEPRLVRLEPSETLPLPKQGALHFHYNEPIDSVPWVAGGEASFRFYRIAAPGGASAAIVAEKNGRAYVDPVNGLFLAFAPDEEIAPASFYRAVFSGVRDLQGNYAAAQTIHYFSFDNDKPTLALISPVPEGADLVSGVQYELRVQATPDTAAVEYRHLVDAGSSLYLTTARTPPFAYRFVAPEAPEEGAVYALRAVATDTSGNVSDPAEIRWTVRRNAAPKDVELSLSATSTYPGAAVDAEVSFADEGILATVQVTAVASRRDGTLFTTAQSHEMRRASVAAQWLPAEMQFALPPDLASDGTVAFTATVTDVRGLSASASAVVGLLHDPAPPVIVSTTPAAESRYRLNDIYRIEAVVADAETDVAEVAFAVDGSLYRVAGTEATPGETAGTKTFTSPQIRVTARNIDTRIPVVVAAADYQGNLVKREFDVVYLGVNDPDAPNVAWLCPLDRAVVPASQPAFPLTLRVSASDETAVTSVSFRVQGVNAPVTATRLGTSNEYTATVAVATPGAGEPFTVTAIVTDADDAHTIESPITIDVVEFDVIVDAPQAVDAENITAFQGRNILVRGTSGALFVNAPLHVRNLALVGGARLATLPTTTRVEHRIELTFSERLYVDCDSAIDVSRTGYLGGWGINEDGSGIINESPLGRTVGNTTTGGAENAGASHGGLGAVGVEGISNLPYGSLTAPTELGGGGAGSLTRGSAGGTGGGAIALLATDEFESPGRVVIAGSLRANGGESARHGGSGGSILVDARQIVVGPRAAITAAGGDAGACGSTEPCGGGGGGRIALSGDARFEVPVARVTAFGGSSASVNGALEAAAGTVYLRRPGQQLGEIHVAGSTNDTPRHTRATPLGDASSALELDALIAGPFALVRFDGPAIVGGIADSRDLMQIDATASVVLQHDFPRADVRTTPATGSQLIRNTSLTLAITADSIAGLTKADIHLSPLSPRQETFDGYPVAVDDEPFVVAVPFDAPLGESTLRVGIADRADRSREIPASTFAIIENVPATITAFDASPGALYPGGQIDVTISASDDISVESLELKYRIGDAPAVVLTRTPRANPATESFVVPVPNTTPGGALITLDASVGDGYPARPPISQSRTAAVLVDAGAPTLVIDEPSVNDVLQEGSGQTFTIRATAMDAEVGVKSVTARVGDGPLLTLPSSGTANEWSGTVPVPAVSGIEIVVVPLRITARDFEGNESTVTRDLRIQPLQDPDAPVMAWICGGGGAMYRAGSTARMRILALPANPSNGVQKVEFFVGGDPTPTSAISLGGGQYEAVFTVPELADEALLQIQVVATAVSGSTNDAVATIQIVRSAVPAITTDTRIDSTNAATYAGGTLIVEGGTVTIDTRLRLDRLVVAAGTVIHSAEGKLELVVDRDLFVACGARIDATGRGYQDATDAAGRTWPDTIEGGSNGGSGGSHGGAGGRMRSSETVAASYGSLFDPSTPGGAGGSDSTAACTPCNMGGGVVRISADLMAVDGQMLASGAATSVHGGAGAGGSIRIDAGTLIGNGEIRADGGRNLFNNSTGWHGAGGGGRVAIYARSMAIPRANVSAAGGGGSSETAQVGAPGTVYLATTDQSDSVIGDELIVANTFPTSAITRLTSVGIRTADEVSSDSLRDLDVAFPAPDQLVGIDVIVDGDRSVRWPVVSNTSDMVRVDPLAPLTATPGSSFRGIQSFDRLTLLNATLVIEDLLEYGSIDQTSSTVEGSNGAAPVVDIGLVALSQSAAGPVLLGRRGAVSDPDHPLTVIAANVGSNESFTGRVASDGSFAIPLFGTAGDPITYFARDANVYPLDSPTFEAGELPVSSAPATGISIASWPVDPGFQAQRLEFADQTLVVSASALYGSSSDRLVLLDASNPALPQFERTVATGHGAIRDLQIVDGIVYVAAEDLAVVDLRDTPAGIAAAAASGSDEAIAVVGGYAFTSARYATDGSINIYDVSSATAPRHLRTQGTAGVPNNTYTDLISLGTGYLVGISNGERDVVVIDRLDIHSLSTAGFLSIPAFDGWRGTIVGNLLYVVSRTSSEMVVIDLTDPRMPQLVGRLQLDSPAGDVAVHGATAFIADGASGLVTAASDPELLATNGRALTGGLATDVEVAAGHAWVATGAGLSIVPVNAPPTVDLTALAMSYSSPDVLVSAGPGGITGTGSLTVRVINDASTADEVAPVSVEGSFSVAIAASPGDQISIEATDGSGRTSTRTTIGTVPFGSSTSVSSIRADGQFRARSLKAEGARVVVASYPAYGTASDKLVVFDVNASGIPVESRIAQVIGGVRDFELRDGWLYVSADGLSLFDLNTANSSRIDSTGPGGAKHALAVSGGYAFTSTEWETSGRIDVFDVSNPAAPRYLRMQLTAPAASNVYTDLLAFGTDYLIGLSPGAGGHDVVVIDRRDVNDLRTVATMTLPGIEAFRGRVAGSRLYVAGKEGGVAMIDLSVASAPQLMSEVDTPGIAYGIEVSDSTVIVADRAVGVTFLDASDQSLRQTGIQFVGGDAWDVAFGASSLYVANEQGLATLRDVAAPPRVDPGLVALAADGAVSGRPGAISGALPITATATNVTTAAAMTVTVASDGQFRAAVPAKAGDLFTLDATDVMGRFAGPWRLGRVPFGTASSQISVRADAQFRARTVKAEASRVVVGSYPAYGTASDKLVVFDVSASGIPVESRIAQVIGGVRDFELRDGWLYVSADGLSLFDLNTANSSRIDSNGPGGAKHALAVSGGYAFTSTEWETDGRIDVFDVSNPAAPRYLRMQLTAPAASNVYTDLLAFGTDYLIGLSPGAGGHDVVVIDRRDVNDLRTVATMTLPGIEAFRGRVAGSRLYVAGKEGGIAMIDLSVVSAPQLMSEVDTPGLAYGIEVSGSSVMVADRGAGVTFLDASDGVLRGLGVHVTGGDAWDVALGGPMLYVANEFGLVTVESVVAPPRIDSTFISIGVGGDVTGIAGAVTGAGPITVDVSNGETGTTVNASVSGDGSFHATALGAAGDQLELSATDAYGRRAGPVVIGAIPFGTSTATLPIRPDSLFRARTVKAEASRVVVGSYPAYGTASDKLVVFDVNASGIPVESRIAQVIGGVRDFELRDGWLFVSADGLSLFDLNTTTSARIDSSGPGGAKQALAVSGGYAFTSTEWETNGRIDVFDVSNPAVPRHLRTQMTAPAANNVYTDLLEYGTDYLIGLSPGAGGHDVVVIDRRDVNDLRTVATMSLPAIEAFRGRVAGSTLYVAGKEGGVAVIDLSVASAPRLMSQVDTPGMAYGIEVSGSTLMVADRGVGVTFLDDSNEILRAAGVQFVGGDVWDVARGGSSLYVANEQGLVVIENVVAPPDIEPDAIGITAEALQATVAGSSLSVGGAAPLQILVRNERTSESSTTVAAGDGQFSTTIAAKGGDRLRLQVTDAAGRMSAVLKTVPFADVKIRLPRDHAQLWARRISSDGTNIIVADGHVNGARVSASARTSISASEGTVGASFDTGIVVDDLEVRGTHALVAGDRFFTIDLTEASPVVRPASRDNAGNEWAVTSIGDHAFTAEGSGSNNGTLHVYDITNPVSAVYLRSQALAGISGISYRDIVPVGNHLIAVSPEQNRDVTVIDASNPSTLTKLAELDIPGFTSFRAALDGETLYLAGGDGGVAVVDLKNPAAPIHRSTIDTPGLARGIAVSAPGEVVVADGSPGLTFIDVRDPLHPALIGSQPLAGGATDVSVIGRQLFVAAETHFYRLERIQN